MRDYAGQPIVITPRRLDDGDGGDEDATSNRSAPGWHVFDGAGRDVTRAGSFCRNVAAEIGLGWTRHPCECGGGS